MTFAVQFGAAAAGKVDSGIMDGDGIEALQKALTAGYGSDVSQLTGGSALRIQSLDRTMKATIQDNDHMKLFNALQKSGATATVDEWTERDSIGGFLGGTTNSETGVIAQAQGNYKRRVAQVKYLMTRAEVSVVVTLGNNIASAKAVEAQNAALRLLTDAEYLSFEGDSAVVPTEFDGITAQMEAGVLAGDVDGENVIDCDAQSLASINRLNEAAAIVARYGNFGKPTDLFMSLKVQADFDNGLDPAFRVALENAPNAGIALGTPVIGIRTSQGNVKTHNDVFIRDPELQTPFQVRYSAVATANTAMKPTLAISAATDDAASKFGAVHAGNYYYLVTGVSAAGESDGAITIQTAVAAGKKVVLTITASGGNAETGYAIYRSRKNGTNAPSDFRLIKRIPKTAGGTTTFTDLNRDIPGTTKAFLLNMAPGADAIAWRQLLPMMEFQLYPTNAAVLPWAQLLFGYLRLAKRKQHVVFKNILPSTATWKPFG